MQEIESLLQRQMENSQTLMENRVAWFYANLLSGSQYEDQKNHRIPLASTILIPKDYTLLPKPKGRRETAVLKQRSLLKKDYLRTQLRDIVETYADAA